MISQETKERLRVEQVTTFGTFKDQHQRKLEDVLGDLDQAARVGMLMAEVMMRHHQLLLMEEHQISKIDISQLFLIFR